MNRKIKFWEYLILATSAFVLLAGAGDVTQVADWGMTDDGDGHGRTGALKDLVVTDVPALITEVNRLNGVEDGTVAASVTTLTASGAATLGSTLAVTGPATLARVATLDVTTNALTLTSSHYGVLIMCNTNTAIAIMLPTNAAPVGAWIDIALHGAATDSCVPTVSSTPADTLVTVNDAAADSVTFDTGHRIGGYMRFWNDGAKWHFVNVAGTDVTIVTN